MFYFFIYFIITSVITFGYILRHDYKLLDDDPQENGISLLDVIHLSLISLFGFIIVPIFIIIEFVDLLKHAYRYCVNKAEKTIVIHKKEYKING